MRRPLALAATLLACDPAVGPELALDMGQVCRNIAFAVRDAAVLPGWEIHAMAVERTGGASAWALATSPGGRLMLQPWPAGTGLELTGLGAPEDFTLLPGAIEGQTWLVLDRDDRTQVWRLDDAADGRLLAGPQLAPQPGWRRRLVFVGQSAYLLAVPRLADASLVELQLAPLPTDTLSPGEPLPLEFWRTCPEDQEAEGGCSTPLISGEIVIEPLGASEAGTTSVSATLLAIYGQRQSESDTAVYTTLVASLELRSAGPDQPPTMVRRDHVPWTTSGEVVVSPAQIAADVAGLFVLAGVRPVPDAAPAPVFDYLIRASRSAGVQDNTVVAQFPKSRQTGLLQLGTRVALLQRDLAGETLFIAPIGNINIDTDATSSLPISSEETVLTIGRGQLLIRGENEGRRVIAGCKRDDE